MNVCKLRAILVPLVLAVVAVSTASADIVYRDLTPDAQLESPGQQIPLDIDGDASTDFVFFYDVYNGGAFLHINVPISSQSGNKVVVTGNHNQFGKDEVRALDAGVLVGPSSQYNGAILGNGPLVAQPSFAGFDICEGLGDVYVGFRIASAGNTYYGWMLIEVNSAGNLCTIKEIAYDDDPGTPVMTGDKGVTLVTAISVEGPDGTMAITEPGGTLQMWANVEPSDATNTEVMWSVDNENVATIDQTGLLTAQGNGEVVVTATAKDGSGVSGWATVTVSGQVVQVTGITVTGTDGTKTITEAGGTLQMEAEVTPAEATNGEVKWSVDDENVATIDQTGLLTAKGNGEVEVTATAQDGSGITGSITITVSGQPVSDVEESGSAEEVQLRVRYADLASGGTIRIEVGGLAAGRAYRTALVNTRGEEVWRSEEWSVDPERELRPGRPAPGVYVLVVRFRDGGVVTRKIAVLQ